MIYIQSKIQVNADDFGLSPSVNLAVIQAFQRNMITSASIMTNMSSFEEACSLIAKHDLNGKIGVHLNLVEGLPVTERIKSIPKFCDERGCFLGKKSRFFTLTPREKKAVEQELDAQIRRSITAGILPAHLDSHHCYHRTWPICSIVIKLARKYSINSVRIERNCGPGIHPVHKLYYSVFNSRLRVLGLARSRLFGSVDDKAYDMDKPLEGIEIMVHPDLDCNNRIIDAWVTEPDNGIILHKRLKSIGIFMEHRLSFIVIGKNQQRTINACISSIFKAAEKLKLRNYEVIYIDSRSSDQTLQIIKSSFGQRVKMYSLNKKMNAAIARNAGAKAANGDAFFFIDGDMELYPDFLKNVYSEEQGLKYALVSGKLLEYEYDEGWNRIGIVNDRYDVVKAERRQDLGGVFIIRSEVFKAVGGFNEGWKSEEDFDLALRLVQKGICLLRLPEYIAVHHTVNYYKFKRLLERILNGQIFYQGSITRKNLLNKYGLKMLFKNQKFTFLLCLSVLSGIYVHKACFLIYPVLILFFKYRKSTNTYLESFFGTLSENISFILGFLFLYPAADNKKSSDYSRI